jgi:hypothetical protein
MAYVINKTDGNTFATVADGTVDTTSSIAIVGRNFAGYGEFLGENFIKLLESGANTTAPISPLEGQLWFNSDALLTTVGITPQTIAVRGATEFKALASLKVATAQPTTSLVKGDLWFDTTLNQLHVNNGTSFTLVGPPTSVGIGTSGLLVVTVEDNASVDHVILKLVIENQDIAYISNDPVFTPNVAISGFATIKPGYQLSTAVSGSLFQGTASNSQLLDSLDSTQFLRSDANDTTSGTLGILNDTGFVVGFDSDFKISVSGSTVTVANETSNGNLALSINDGGVQTEVINIDAATGEAQVKHQGVLTNAPTTDGGIANKKYVDDSIGSGTSGALLVNGSNDISGVINPSTNGNIDFGTTAKRFKDIFSNTFIGNLTGDVTGDVTGSADTWTNSRTITLTGDCTGAFVIDGSGNVSFATTVVGGTGLTLGTDTAGNYVEDITGGTGVTVTGGPSEGATPIISIGQSVATTSNVQFANMQVDGDLTVNGTTTTVNTETIKLADNQILLNSNETGVPSQNGGIEIERGTSANKTLVWSESTDKWTVGTETMVAGTFEGALNGTSANATNVVLASSSTNASFFVPFASGGTGNQELKTDSGMTYNPSTNVLAVTSTQAQYADLAERFEADDVYTAGTVVELGGICEITEAIDDLTNNVFGVISTSAAYLMNAGAGNNETHPPVAMNGRVPVRVTGKVKKGDRLVSAGNGVARAATVDEITAFNVIGRSLEDKINDEEGTVEAIVKVN